MVIYKSYKKAICIMMSLGIISLFSPASFASSRPDAKIVVEAYSGKVLYTEDADAYRYPASLTKMMTLYLIFDELKAGRLKQSSRLKVSQKASQAVPSKLGLKAGETISVKDAIFALITKSANDVAITVAENISGSEAKFAQKMTKKAREIGMSRTTFKNASGLPHTEQRTTARDMATLGRMLLIHHADYYHYFNTKSYKIGSHSYTNHNKLLGRYDGLDGIKTGYIQASGFNLVASAQRQDMRLVAVVIGGETSASRNEMMVNILDKGFFNLASARKTWVSPQKKPSFNVASQNYKTETTIATATKTEGPIDELLEKALTADLPPERPPLTNSQMAKAPQNIETKAIATEASGDVITSILSTNTPSQPSVNTGKYTIELASMPNRNMAEQESKAALYAIQNLAPNGVAQVQPITDHSGSMIYKPIIEGLDGVEALTACQIIETQGKACKIIA